MVVPPSCHRIFFSITTSMHTLMTSQPQLNVQRTPVSSYKIYTIKFCKICSKAKLVCSINITRISDLTIIKRERRFWLKVKHYKTGENRKLSPCRNGPWLVIEKLPNGVNFRIIYDQTKQQKIVHNDRLSPVCGSEWLQGENEPPLDKKGQLIPNRARDGCSSSDFSSDSNDSEYEDDPSSSDKMETPTSPWRYPHRL